MSLSILKHRRCVKWQCTTTRQYFFLFLTVLKLKKCVLRGFEVDPWQLHYVPDRLKTQEMFDATMREDPSSLVYIPDWFVTQGQVKIWHDGYDYCDDDRLIEWYEVYQKHKVQKAKIERVNADRLASIKMVGLVHVRRQEEID